MKYEAILFDLDGTLVDSLEDLTDAINDGLRRLRQPTQTPEQCREMIGRGREHFVRQALPKNRQDLFETLLTTMTEYYDAHCCEKSRPYPGIETILPVLKQKGIRMAVISNKNHPQTEKIVTHFFGRDTFEFIGGMNDSRKAKPDPEMPRAALRALSAAPGRAILIGDGDTDMLAARAAGIDAAGVAWGYRPIELLRKTGARQILTSPRQILNLIA